MSICLDLHQQEAHPRVTAFAKQGTTNTRIHAHNVPRESSSRWRAMRRAATVEWANTQRIWVGYQILTCISCEAGKFGATTGQGEDCQECAAGKFSSVVEARSDTVCQDCPSGQTSSAGSDSQSDCSDLCAAGWTGPAGSCIQCQIGKYKPDVGSRKLFVMSRQRIQHSARTVVVHVQRRLHARRWHMRKLQSWDI